MKNITTKILNTLTKLMIAVGEIILMVAVLSVVVGLLSLVVTLVVFTAGIIPVFPFLESTLDLSMYLFILGVFGFCAMGIAGVMTLWLAGTLENYVEHRKEKVRWKERIGK